WIKKRCQRAWVCLEASGIYSLEPAMALHRVRGVRLMVANPKAVRDFAGAFLRRSKTDALDADVLLEFARRMPFVSWQPPAPEVLELRALARRIEGLQKMLSQERNRLHAAGRSAAGAAVQEDVQLHIAHLRDRIRGLRHHALTLVAEHPRLARRLRQLCSIKGIADASAIQILAELETLPPGMTVRQWVAHAGLDPRHFESGTSVHKRPRISKAGNKHLRRALFMPALVAIQWEPNVNAFYEHLLDGGKTKMQANVAVMRKLIHAFYGMFKHDALFDGEKFFAPTT
ncbi:MAG: IS110 family transposase, partial [Acidobacteriota bacterium]